MIVSLKLNIGDDAVFIPVYDNTSLQISKFLTSVDNLSKSGTITEERFRVNLNKDLITAIGDLTDPSQEISIDLNKSISGEILVDGVARFKGSFFILESFRDPVSNLKEIELLFQGGETDIKAELKSVSMASLFEGESISYAFSNIKAYLDDPHGFISTNGYAFPLIDYGQRWTNNGDVTTRLEQETFFDTLFQNDFKPALKLEHIFSKLPYQITWDTSIDDLMLQMILLHNSKSRTVQLDTSPLDFTGGFQTNVSSKLIGNNTFKINFQLNNSYKVANLGLFDLTTDEYQVDFTGVYEFSVSGSVFIENDSGIVSVNNTTLGIYDYSTMTPTLLRVVDSTDFSLFAGQDGTINYSSTVSLQLENGMFVGLGIVFLNNGSFGASDITVNTSFSFSVLNTPSIVSTSSMLIPANCPELSAWDIVETVLLQCNGVLQSNADGTYNIIPWETWIDLTVLNTYFIDNILDYDKNISLQPFSLEGAKTIKIGYKEGADYNNVKYKEQQENNYGELVIEDTGSALTKNELKIELPVGVLPNSYIEQSSIVIPKFYDNDFKTLKGTPKLLHYKLNEDMPCYFAFEDITGTVTTTYFYNELPFFGNWESVIGGFTENDYNFGQSLTFWSALGYPNNTLYERFWKKYIENTYTQDSRMLKCSIRLTQNQFDSLQFNEKFFYKGSVFRLIEISGYELTEKDTVDATFMKMFDVLNVDKAPFYPTNVIGAVVQWANSTTNAALGDASGQTAADVEESANAYGFFYDSNQNIATQIGQILQT